MKPRRLTLLGKLKRFLYDLCVPNHFYLNRLLSQCDSIVDLGCGTRSLLERLRVSPAFSLGIDVHQPSIDYNQKHGIYTEYRCIDLSEIERHLSEKFYDAVLMFDVLEHLTKDDGTVLLEKAQRIAKKFVIVHTPSGFFPQAAAPDNPMEEHLSGWTVEEMRRLGYEVRGSNGLKMLRGDYTRIKWKPTFFWLTISFLTNYYVIRKPKSAYHILCVKTIKPAQ